MTYPELSPTDQLKYEILHGFSSPQKKISPKFLYDQSGSELFEKISHLKEYYPTRTEISILKSHLSELSEFLEPYCTLLEYGSGSSMKTRILLDSATETLTYIPIDISEDFLFESTKHLAEDYPDLRIYPISGDFTNPLSIPRSRIPIGARKIVFFPGSTIGNFDPKEARALLSNTARFVGEGGRMIVGVDLIKDIPTLEAAYNDSEGVTAAFNLNLLKRLNTELHTNFNLSQFKHWAFFNPKEHRIEMHLVSLVDQWVDIGRTLFHLKKFETIHTENSYKYHLDDFSQLAYISGFKTLQYWTDPKQLFAVFLLEADFEALGNIQSA